MKKFYILDSNILFQSCGNAIFGFEDNYVIITQVTLDELDKHKDDFVARESLRILDNISSKGNAAKGIRLDNGGFLMIYADDFSDAAVPAGLDRNKPDVQIIQSALKIKSMHPRNKVILVSNDREMRIDGRLSGIEVQEYKNGVIDLDSLYTGRTVLSVDSDTIDEVYRNKEVDPEDLGYRGFVINEYVRLESMNTFSGHRKSVLTRYYDNRLHVIEQNKSVGIKPRNEAQTYAIDMLLDYNVPLNIMIGPAGCGKTYLSLAVALHMIQNTNYNKLYITRTNTIPEKEDLGFLPGDLEEKMEPLLYPFYDNLEYISQDTAQELIDKGIIDICPMAYIRGRNIENSIIIVDECQNMSRIQAKTLVTRAGNGTKIILLGDPNQIDNPRVDSRSNGLVYVAEKMKDERLAAQIIFNENECVRSELSKVAAINL